MHDLRSAQTSKLIDYCLKGKKKAWETLVDRYKDYVYSVIGRFFTYEDDRNDVFQNVFLILYENLENLKNADKLTPYLFQITRRECLRVLRVKNKSAVPTDTILEGFGYHKSTETPEELFEKLEDKIIIAQAIERLSDRCRTLINKLFLEADSLSYNELAALLGIPPSSIGPTRQRCLNKLKQILEKMGIE